MAQESLDTLVQKARKGDRTALERLLEAHRAPLRSWVSSRLGDRLRRQIDAEDIVQEAQLRALESIQRFTPRGEGSFLRWLCTIALHLIWSASQKRSGKDLTLAVEPPGSGVSPSRSLRRQERLERLEESLARLRPEEREVVKLSRIEGLKVREIAERVGRPEPTVKSLIARSLRKLREDFGDTESLHLPACPEEAPEGKVGAEGKGDPGRGERTDRGEPKGRGEGS
jgi:RNA polymerase sigma-70 factor (ECF subfamily)